MNRDGWIDIARTGTFTAGNGKKATFTTGDFDRLASGFDESQRRIPLVFGHPKDNAPAYGWVEGLRRAGNTLQARFKQVHDDVKTLVHNGNFKNVSISVSPDLSFLHHVGLLGATQPAIPGLREISFADSADCLTFEFSADVLHEEEERLREEIAQLKAQLEEQQGREAEKDKEGKLERLKDTVRQGKVSPAEFALLEPFAVALLESDSMLTFAASPEPVHALDAFIDIFESRPISPLALNFAGFAPPPAHIDRDADEDRNSFKRDNPAYII